MTKIEATFNETFAQWEIRLPPGTVAQGGRGTISLAGWVIWYLAGADESGEYLDYYASHRMTNDRHVRIRADGSCQGLPAIRDFRLRSDDPEEDARLAADYFAENQEVARMLAAKGFGPVG